MTKIVTEVFLPWACSRTGEKTKVTILVHNGTILLRPEGYGDYCSEDGNGWPILFEIYEGKPRVVVWGDINQEEHTEMVELGDQAREDNREET